MNRKRKVPAKVGLDWVRGEGGRVQLRTEKGWRRWARRVADRMSRRDGVRWEPATCRIEGGLRISFATQKEELHV